MPTRTPEALKFIKTPTSFIKLSFFHIAAMVEVSFNAYITKFEDQYSSEWSNTIVYGRMDPIGTFKSTSRKISLGWTVPSDSLEEAKENFHKGQTLISMLYPVYDQQAGRQASLKASPLLKVKLGNLIIKAGENPTVDGSAATSGLICSANGFTLSPELEEGFFFFQEGNMYPQTLKFDGVLQIYHDVPLGWGEELIDGNEIRFSERNFADIESRKRQSPFPELTDGSYKERDRAPAKNKNETDGQQKGQTAKEDTINEPKS
jgi:hypothetical protein